jgi:hypothetical protein
MKTFSEPVILGRTGLQVGRLGISSSYGAPAAAFEEAFEKGCNYFVLGTFMKGRSEEMVQAIRNIVARGQRDKLVVCLMEYTHSPLIGKGHFHRGLKKLGLWQQSEREGTGRLSCAIGPQPEAFPRIGGSQRDRYFSGEIQCSKQRGRKGCVSLLRR